MVVDGAGWVVIPLLLLHATGGGGGGGGEANEAEDEDDDACRDRLRLLGTLMKGVTIPVSAPSVLVLVAVQSRLPPAGRVHSATS